MRVYLKTSLFLAYVALFFDDSLVKELEKEGFFTKIYSR